MRNRKRWTHSEIQTLLTYHREHSGGAFKLSEIVSRLQRSDRAVMHKLWEFRIFNTWSPKRAVPRGEQNHGWKGAAAKTQSKRKRARQKFPQIGPCVECGKSPAERHHKDGDAGNNDASNIKVLCRRCHMLADGRLNVLRAYAKQTRAATPGQIILSL